MESLEMRGPNLTLVDVVEEKLLQYLKDNDYCIGCTVPNEMELASSLGVARSVVREALSRLKMIGLIVVPEEAWLSGSLLFWAV